MNHHRTNYSSNGNSNLDQFGRYQESVLVTSNKALQAQDRIQQLVNDTSGRYFADMEKIVQMYSKSFQPMYSAYAPGDQDIKKRLQNIEMATLTLNIQVNQGSKDPSLPPVKLGQVPEYHLMNTIECASKISDNNVREFLLQNLNIFRTQVASVTPVTLPEQYATPGISYQASHASARDQERLIGTCNQAHDIGDHIEKRLKKELAADNSRYAIPVTPLITEAEVNGISNTHMRHSHPNGHSHMVEETPQPFGNQYTQPPAYQSFRS